MKMNKILPEDAVNISWRYKFLVNFSNTICDIIGRRKNCRNGVYSYNIPTYLTKFLVFLAEITKSQVIIASVIGYDNVAIGTPL